MDFVFFNGADQPLFVRNDAEQAEHTHEELSLYMLFPYDPRKIITHGMRVGYTDSRGDFQMFEIRKAIIREPDHYQEITAEHIAVSELTDEVFPETAFEEDTAQDALTALLAGTNWSVGAVSSANTATGTVGLCDVWAGVRAIEKSWNVFITPRITINATGITGRYLDITPTTGTFRGLRLSLEKNMTDAAITWDDTNVKTALYGFGKMVDVEGQDEQAPLTFADVVWTTAGGDPANKPDGQTYVEDAEATALYGRNGRARFGYYQNAEIEDAEELLQKTWAALETMTTPEVSVDGTVSDLMRLGAADVPIRLHDIAQIEITPTGTVLERLIIRYTEDLLNHLSSRVNAGVYIPDLVYITTETVKKNPSSGSGSGNHWNSTNVVTNIYTKTVRVLDDNEGIITITVFQNHMQYDSKNITYLS